MSRDREDREADFLSRWSRRKRDARHAPTEPEEQAAPAPAAAAEAAEKSEAEILEELGLPDPETLGPGSDFRAFMAEAVPDFIRRKALRKLWSSNPVLANLDMLVDYGEDYTDKARVVANLQTAYRAGRGYLDRLPADAGAEEAAAPAEAPAGAAQETAAGGAEDAPNQAAAEGQEDVPQERAAAPGEPAATDPEAEEETAPEPDSGETPSADETAPIRTTLAEMPPPRRRMRFDFE